MLRGLYTAASGMDTASMSIDTLANNLANVNTVGFKANKLNFQSFPEMLIQKIDDQGEKPIGSIMTGSKVQQSFINFAAGSIHQTGNPFDLAIHGDGFFNVESAEGKSYYTRAGNFTVNEAGFLTTMNGDHVQGAQGDIQLKLDDAPFQINGQGQISAKGQVIGQITVTRFKNNQALEKLSENLYQAGQAAEEVTGNDGKNAAQIQQGALEESNVNPVAELVNNIQGMRLYEALQKNIHMHNDTLGKAVNEVGRYR